jgi:ADP-heptose:LPS heptosyltransferase
VWRPDEHEVARWCRLVLDGLPADGPVPSVAGCLPLPPDAGVPAGLTVVHCGAKSAARRWPADRFAAVARALAVSGLDVVVTGGVTERAIAERIAADSGTRAVTDLDLAHLISLVGQARLLVCGDTGVAHVASNYRTPSVVLFGPVSPAVWGPPADPRHQVLWHGDGRGDPHGPVLDPALARISVDEVLLACDRALAVDPDRPERVGVAP